MHIFKSVMHELSGVKELKNCIDTNNTPVSVNGLSPVHKAQLCYAFEDETKTHLILLPDESDAQKLCADINRMAGKDIARFLPAKEFLLTHAEGSSREYEHIRLEAFSAVISGDCRFLVAGAESSLQKTIPPKVLKENTIILKSDMEQDLIELSEKLCSMGYERCDKVEGPAQFSMRGAIFDVFSPAEKQPYRIELWGDEIDSISFFDTETQRRVSPVYETMITPAIETVISYSELKEKIKKLSSSVRGKRTELIREKLLGDIKRIDDGLSLTNIDKYLPICYEKSATVFDYADGFVFALEYSTAAERMKSSLMRFNEDVKILLETGDLCKSLDEYYLDSSEFHEVLLERKSVFVDNFIHQINDVPFRKIISIEALQTAPWGGETRQLCEDLTALCKEGYRTVLVAGNDKTIPLIANDLRESGIECDIALENVPLTKGRVLITEGQLSSGLQYPQIKFAIVTQTKAEASTKRRKKFKKGKEISALSDISAGDLVVHSLHGIGRFVGIRKLELEGVTKDYITIQYAGKDTLYVPVTQLDMVSRYIGPRDDAGVKLSKLSSTEWQKTRNNVKRAVKDMAKELAALYAKREKSKGFAFSQDSDMQDDFENRFPYSETPDQLQCIDEIKEDMEKIRPMDRLLCGDVGFGKTEVALRAVFKCVYDGKQAALLAPTTVLAWQHFQTALRRFEHFPIKIELLSRLRNPAQQQEILRKLKRGEIDFIIGTHRLVQKDIVFNDLGLAVIDEEQRFGVAHKEKFKEMFSGVDILTLSATPIPRTLNMAMSGIRDMSVIEDPPQDRHPVQTYVIEHDMGLIAQALAKEIRRGGQCYYIHNRVESIMGCAAKLNELIPDARIAYAHGQMNEEAMSEIWESLVNHEIDILVCTTIIETGVDVPNVNTLVIEDADKLGLSQLYQLRGRVGRSNRRAYAYFTFRRDKVLNEVATKRLEAIREFTQFGSGFRIAMRDLEIRGAGSILGGKQHGHMESVGYDMYMKLLSEAVAEERGEPIKRATDCVVDIQIEAHIPEDYISSLSQRLEVYKSIAAVTTDAESLELTDELIDRYGEPPKAIMGLIKTSLLRNTAASLGITEISQKGNQLIFYTEHPSPDQISALSGAYKGRILFMSLDKPYIAVKMGKNEKAVKLMEEVLKTMCG